jgi:hypothetical protein
LLDFTTSPESGVLIGDIGTVLSPVLEFSADVTAICDALGGSTPDLTTAFQDLVNMPADITNAFLNRYGDVDVTSLVQDPGLTSVPFFGTSADITGVTVDLGGLLRGAGSLFDSIGIGLDTELGYLNLDGVAVGPIASIIELDQSIAPWLGRSR